MNKTQLINENITHFSYNSTNLSLNLSSNWNGHSSNYLYELANTLSTNTHLTLQNNFTNQVYTYCILLKGISTAGTYLHNATFEILLLNNTTGFSTKMVIAHNITSDVSFHYKPLKNETVIVQSILGDGLPVANNSINITIPPNYYVYIGIGNENAVDKFIPHDCNISSPPSKCETGNIKI